MKASMRVVNEEKETMYQGRRKWKGVVSTPMGQRCLVYVYMYKPTVSLYWEKAHPVSLNKFLPLKRSLNHPAIADEVSL